MQPSESYVLVLDQHSDDLQMLEALLSLLKCPMVIANSVDQAINRVSLASPYLVILGGSYQNWSDNLINQLRNHAMHATIVVLTDVHAPRWLHQEESPGLDGFLVKPLSHDVVDSLVQSAWARQIYRSA